MLTCLLKGKTFLESSLFSVNLSACAFQKGFDSLCFLFSKASNSPKSSLAVPMGPPVYVDLAYIPNHCSGKNTDPEFFKRVRASYYVVSGNDAANGEPSRAVLDALLEGKSQWGENLQVCHGSAWECMFLLVS